mmetsp:Transcript_28002/g.56467  ORF Transcript_28002/g.56467 Transcript_28002/m.56467 type:complete len:203 (-) Transcript_28002:73-681(-)
MHQITPHDTHGGAQALRTAGVTASLLFAAAEARGPPFSDELAQGGRVSSEGGGQTLAQPPPEPPRVRSRARASSTPPIPTSFALVLVHHLAGGFALREDGAVEIGKALRHPLGPVQRSEEKFDAPKVRQGGIRVSRSKETFHQGAERGGFERYLQSPGGACAPPGPDRRYHHSLLLLLLLLVVVVRPRAFLRFFERLLCHFH